MFSLFILSAEGGQVASLSKQNQSASSSLSQTAAAKAKPTAPIHIVVQEKIALSADRNGGLEQFEVSDEFITMEFAY